MLGEVAKDTALSRRDVEALERGLTDWQRTGTWTREDAIDG